MKNNLNQNIKPWLKALYVLPVVAVSLMATSKTFADCNAVESQRPMLTDIIAPATQAVEDTVKADNKAGKGESNVITEQMPGFKGGQGAMMQYLSSNVHYPEVAQKWGVQGRVLVSFIVNEDGTLSDHKVVSTHIFKPETVDTAAVDSVSLMTEEQKAEKEKGEAEGKAAIEQEALRVAKSMPAWNPGVKDGKPVRIKFNIPLTFRLR